MAKDELEERRNAWRRELLEFLDQMRSFHTDVKSMQRSIPDIMLDLSGFSARASQFRVATASSSSQILIRFRYDEVEPFLEEVDRQFKIYSRIHSVNELDFNLTK